MPPIRVSANAGAIINLYYEIQKSTDHNIQHKSHNWIGAMHRYLIFFRD